MAIKLWLLGIYRYLAHPANAFDGLVTLVTVAADMVALAGGWPHRLTRVALSLRTLRMLRVFTTVRQFRSIVLRLLRLLPKLTGLFGALWFLFSVYAQFGVFLFGGKIYVGDVYEHTNGTDVLYTYCNFNDFGSAFVTLFELLVVNNWQVIMNEAVIVSGEWSRVYFISWWVSAVLVMSNLLVAFILQGYQEGDGLQRASAPEAHGPIDVHSNERSRSASRMGWERGLAQPSVDSERNVDAGCRMQAASLSGHVLGGEAGGLQPLLAVSARSEDGLGVMLR